ncbi:MAG: BON domain-containing protein [Betaproteobacteria bacterium]|nr:BON domain-containing protein [Betaproteobacteria bacterium]
MKGNRFLTPCISILLVALAGGAISTSPASAQAAAQGSPEFKRLDADRDGYVSRAEAKRIADFDKAFREADDNRDGRLDADEFVKAQSIHERMRAGQYLDDSMITAKVKAALLKDLRLKGLDVKVETHKAIVLLSGFVKDEEQVRRAAEIAAGIEGVAAVKNSLMVKS